MPTSLGSTSARWPRTRSSPFNRRVTMFLSRTYFHGKSGTWRSSVAGRRRTGRPAPRQSPLPSDRAPEMHPQLVASALDDVDAAGSALVRGAERACDESADLGATALCDESYARADDALGDQSCKGGEGCGGAAAGSGGARAERALGGRFRAGELKVWARPAGARLYATASPPSDSGHAPGAPCRARPRGGVGVGRGSAQNRHLR
jgi:hypothetical protein